MIHQARLGYRRSSRRLICVAVVLHAAVTGCSSRTLRPVDSELAKATLVETLDTWKRGGTIQELRERVPEIVAQDLSWSQGALLIDYRLLDDGREEDANLFCQVELALKMAGRDKPEIKNVTYVIGTAPVLTVFRAIL